MGLAATVFTVKSFRKSWLTFGFMIAYVYLACWLILSLCTALLRSLTDIAGRHNFLWLRDIIARQRGISAYPLGLVDKFVVPSKSLEYFAP